MADPLRRELLKGYTRAEISRPCEEAAIHYAPVATVDDLFEDAHLKVNGLLDVELPGGVKTRLPRLPVEVGTHELGLRREAPQLGEHTREILSEAGIGEERLADLEQRRVVVVRGGDALA